MNELNLNKFTKIHNYEKWNEIKFFFKFIIIDLCNYVHIYFYTVVFLIV